MLSVDALLDPLTTRVPYEYEGRQDIQFRGIALRARRRLAGGQFVVLVDSHWGKRAQKKFGYSGRTPGEVITEADANGATGFIVNDELRGEPALEGKNCFYVGNTLDFAFRLVETVRALTAQKVVAVTGSAGKSTTKAMITHVLGSLSPEPEIYNPPSTDNIFSSVICQLSRMDNFDYSVLEVAGSAFLRFHKNSFTVSPDVAIVTSISEAHLDYLDDLAGVAQRKARLFDTPPPGGTAVINLDTPCADLLLAHAKEQGSQVVTFGESAEAMVRLVDYQAPSRRAVIETDGERLEITIGAEGRHMAVNSLAVLAALRALGIPDWQQALRSLETFRALAGRGETSSVPIPGGTVTLIDEAYNANPASIRAALDAMAHRQVEDGGRRVVVLADMLELGAHAAEIHRNLAPAFDQLAGAEVHLLGENMAALFGALEGQISTVKHWDSLAELKSALLGDLRPGDIMLLKGSNGMGLGEIVRDLHRMKPVEPVEPVEPEERAEPEEGRPAKRRGWRIPGLGRIGARRRSS